MTIGPPALPLAPDSIRRRRDERLIRVLRWVGISAVLGALSTLPGFGGAWDTQIVHGSFLALIGLSGAYGGAYWMARSGRHDVARSVLFSAWIAYLGIQLGMYGFSPPEPYLAMLLVGICTAFAALAIVGVAALETWERTQRWIVGVLMVYGGAGMVLSLTCDLTWPQRQLWLTTFVISWVLLLCAGAFVRAFASDLYASLAHSELSLTEARGASAAKTRFLANMSHELRTPLNGIIGYVELLREEILELGVLEGVDQDLEKVWLAATHLHMVIGDVLDLSKIEAGKVELSIREADLKRAVSQVVSTSEPLARGRGNRIEVRYVGAPDRLWTDEGRLRQVLLNLLSNSAKFTQNGRISLIVEGRESEVCFEVTDTGIGIPLDKLEAVFQPFEQADGSTTREFGGTGLGLAISSRLVEGLGGVLQVHSVVNEGSSFTFCLPVRPP